MSTFSHDLEMSIRIAAVNCLTTFYCREGMLQENFNVHININTGLHNGIHDTEP